VEARFLKLARSLKGGLNVLARSYLFPGQGVRALIRRVTLWERECFRLEGRRLFWLRFSSDRRPLPALRHRRRRLARSCARSSSTRSIFCRRWSFRSLRRSGSTERSWIAWPSSRAGTCSQLGVCGAQPRVPDLGPGDRSRREEPESRGCGRRIRVHDPEVRRLPRVAAPSAQGPAAEPRDDSGWSGPCHRCRVNGSRVGRRRSSQ
jgi:hypothetical protein